MLTVYVSDRLYDMLVKHSELRNKERNGEKCHMTTPEHSLAVAAHMYLDELFSESYAPDVSEDKILECFEGGGDRAKKSVSLGKLGQV
ncbi:hypothetical protein ALO_12806 [Acetonema longum DSM 6540]|uniref:Uncharacterized protein n=2 Tax=Acetonema TaxID=2373 RepID=F7NKE8_9FIRM|nr:hypothetical protein ALO_12806 [Acetonema longum DSM 6540]